jgi:hypothetical protein
MAASSTASDRGNFAQYDRVSGLCARVAVELGDSEDMTAFQGTIKSGKGRVITLRARACLVEVATDTWRRGLHDEFHCSI